MSVQSKMSLKKILHIAPFNTAGVPSAFVDAERKMGFDSQLVTLGKSSFASNKGICLNLPFMTTPGIGVLKRLVSHPSVMRIQNIHKIPKHIPKYWTPNGVFEKTLIQIREKIWQKKINRISSDLYLFSFDVVQLDGGLEFYRDARTIKNLKENGKTIICCYTGSDLRVRGVIPEIDAISDLNVTVEFDHIYFHPNIHHVFFPFNLDRFELVKKEPGETVRIGHAPTNREAKGSDEILAALNHLKNASCIEIVLIENLPYERAIELKATCDIFVDQIGDLGYGINSLEAMAMGIPAASSLAKGFNEKNKDHPFIEINSQSIEKNLKPFIEDHCLRERVGIRSREWVKENHNPENVVRKIHQLAGI